MSGSDYYHIVLRFGAFGWVGRWWAANDQQGKMFPFIVIWEYYSLFTTIVYDIQYIIFATIQYCMINRSWVMIKYDKLCQSYFVGVWVCPQIGYHFMCCLTIYLQIQWSRPSLCQEDGRFLVAPQRYDRLVKEGKDAGQLNLVRVHEDFRATWLDTLW